MPSAGATTVKGLPLHFTGISVPPGQACYFVFEVPDGFLRQRIAYIALEQFVPGFGAAGVYCQSKGFSLYTRGGIIVNSEAGFPLTPVVWGEKDGDFVSVIVF